MTNEELVALVQEGKKEYLEPLWEGVRLFVEQEARRTIKRLGGRCGVTVEDLCHAGYLAMLHAAERFDPSMGPKFLSYFSKCLPGFFNYATGYHYGRKLKYDPMDYARNLDEPINPESDDSALLSDLIPDPAAERAFDTVADYDTWQRLHNAVEMAIESLPNDEAAAIRARYYTGGEWDKKAFERALRSLRHPSVSKPLRKFLR